MRRYVCALAVIALLFGTTVVLADAEEKGKKSAQKRQEIDKVAQEALAELKEKSPAARELSAKAYGYAVFDNLKIQFLLSGGGGAGVAVEKSAGKRTYMKMGTGGVGLGLGGQRYQVIFLFENKGTFDSFVEKGWNAEVSGQAAAGTSGAGTASTFNNGIAAYQITEKGLMASVDITGTKYWKSKKLNR